MIDSSKPVEQPPYSFTEAGNVQTIFITAEGKNVNYPRPAHLPRFDLEEERQPSDETPPKERKP